MRALAYRFGYWLIAVGNRLTGDDPDLKRRLEEAREIAGGRLVSERCRGAEACIRFLEAQRPSGRYRQAIRKIREQIEEWKG